MSEEKIEAKTSMLKGFFTNPLSWLLSSIAIGTLLFNIGGSSANRKNDVTVIEKKVDDLSKKVDQVITTQKDFSITLTDFTKAKNKMDADFEALEQSHVNNLTLINRIDDVVKYYENKAELEKKK